ncbi:hypothetical protein J2S11_001913 [Bacillus horti]|uniref:DUF3139 domain-containing protein n=1 Tax=Caldalkalibacillus horti TaxID=77523 RepID=A0ABT9VYD9_9BACI|nr:hypothetical protein [Bacillus horti]
MNSITSAEIMLSTGLALVVYLVCLLSFKDRRKMLKTYSVLAVLIYSFVLVLLPMWIDYQVKERIDTLEVHLEDRFPGEQFEVIRSDYRMYSPTGLHYIDVTFDNEPNREYKYSVSSDGEVMQLWYYPRDADFDSEGKFAE